MAGRAQGQVKLLYFNLDLGKQLSPILPLKHWRYNRIIKEAIALLVEDAYSDYTKSDGVKTIVVGLAVKPFVERGEPIPPIFSTRSSKTSRCFSLPAMRRRPRRSP